MNASIAQFDPQVQENLSKWLNGNVDQTTKDQILNLIEESPQEASDAFYTSLSFGTGGLRGILGLGPNRMNLYTVGLATQGLANYLNTLSLEESQKSLLIGYDSRNFSKEFAQETACILAANGFKAYLFKDIRPLPLVSFGSRHLNCCAAIMITASHNPPQYNGYKVFWEDGGQVLPPHDEEIIHSVKSIKSLDAIKKVHLNHPLISILDEEIDKAYLKEIEKYKKLISTNLEKNAALQIVYTALHGTGITIIPKALKDWGFNQVVLLEQQNIPDGNFPTLKNPNPEEREALSQGIEVLKKHQADLLIATDPDTDRLGVAFLHKDKVKIISGNQIACLILYYICSTIQKKGLLSAHTSFIKTIVTTELFRAIAESFQVNCLDVLTGFKYIGQTITKWEKEKSKNTFLFGAEESYGYLLGQHARDKDAVITSIIISEIASSAKQEGKTLLDLLYQIYKQFGIYQEGLKTLNFSPGREGERERESVMQQLRENPYPFILGKKVIKIHDYLIGKSIDLDQKKQSTITLPQSNVITLILSDESRITIRPSGTEPKVKIYCGVILKEFNDVEKGIQSSQEYLQSLMEDISLKMQKRSDS